MRKGSSGGIIMEDKTCATCFRIACKRCEWVAVETEVQQIQQGKLTACPQCGWKPEKND